MPEQAHAGQPEASLAAVRYANAGIPWLLAGKPDWNAIHFDVTCSRCGYDLRLIQEPRCPECGLTFAWMDVLDRSAHRNEFLFEHVWRKQPVRSYLRTVWHSLRPRHFWRRVSIHNHIHSGPLVFLLLISLVMVTMLGSVPLLLWWLDHVTFQALPLSIRGSTVYQYIVNFVELGITHSGPSYYSGPIRGPLLGLFGPGMILLLLFATVASLRQTLGRCRVRTAQILRVVAYTAPAAAAWWCLLLGVHMLVIWMTKRVWFRYGGEPGFGDLLHLSITPHPDSLSILLAGYGLVLFLLFLLIPVVYLRVGLRDYLRLPHATSIAAATLIIACLVLPVLFLVVIFPALGRL